MTTKKIENNNTGIILVVTYIVLFVVNSIIILLANTFFPLLAVLGTVHISETWAIIHSVGALTLINTFAIPFVREYEKRSNKMFGSKEWMGFYFVINFLGIWLVTRFADQLGFGVSSWLVILVLALVLDLIQGIVMMQVENIRIKQV